VRFYEIKNPVVISLEVSDEIVEKRMLKRGRMDDNKNDIKNRLDFYHRDVIQAIEYFKNNPYYKFISINGEPSIEDVHKDLMEKLGI
jgi:adenylate kinase family enzyme